MVQKVQPIVAANAIRRFMSMKLTVALVIFIISISYNTSNGQVDLSKMIPQYTLDDIIISLEFLSGLEGGELKAGQSGYALLQIHNKSNEVVVIPICFEYSLGRVDLKPNYLSEVRSKKNSYRGFEVAKLSYGFNGDGIKNIINPLPCIIKLQPNKSESLMLSIKAPQKPGTYDFEFFFDNRNLENAIRSRGVAPYLGITKSLFHKNLTIPRVTIRK